MKKFDVEITETLQRKVSVEAASQEDAERMVTQAWNNQDYVLDSGDFTGVDFKTVGEHELAETRTMDVLLVQPNAYPKKISVGTELEDLQAMVGGDIEVTYPFEDEVAIILNESGKINGLPLNRAIYTEDGDMQDIYAGDFLVVGLTEDDFGSLTSEQMQKFEEQFHQPQMFVRMGRSIMAMAPLTVPRRVCRRGRWRMSGVLPSRAGCSSVQQRLPVRRTGHRPHCPHRPWVPRP